MNSLSQLQTKAAPPHPRGGLLNPASLNLKLPAHSTYVETRGSLGAWLFRKPRSQLEVLNDTDGEAVNLSRVVIDQSTRDAFAAQAVVLLGGEPPMFGKGKISDQIARAMNFATTVEQATARFRRSNRSRRRPLRLQPGLDWLDRVFERLDGVQVEHGTTDQVIRRYDMRQSLFVCDERGTDWDADHGNAVLDSVRAAAGKIILVTGRVENQLAGDNRWRHSRLLTGDILWRNF